MNKWPSEYKSQRERSYGELISVSWVQEQKLSVTYVNNGHTETIWTGNRV